ncbi:T9SS type B sorting domain-containing protein [Mesonia maritima]|uniref:Gliding motility-associated-like protein n=1 Tax=Mesonia maritima TaxID=1793873 RepID=A0ABU1K795_9FLAO|nr:T9SS type B sorting domain-containing protein [Mesonia maritima]MDR6301479.1 gliding motility-associated-like protein [Mesonia maritima]
MKTFFLLLGLCCANMMFAQEPNDCINAIVICGNDQFSSNSEGIGQSQEISGCGSEEHNSLWLEINIVQGGTLGFDLIPNSDDLVVDYDFWVFGPNPDCNNLGDPIRCSTTNPLQANLTSNHTGIDGSNPNPSQGPGQDGTGYVQWLDVLPGEMYYIAIDRPHGDGGFSMNWTGTANQGSGAFPTPPIANQIETVRTCSNDTTQEFDLASLKQEINANLTDNAITFHATQADAFDGINELPDNYTNTSNPQVIYAKATSIINFCFTIVDIQLEVNPIENDVSLEVSQPIICGTEEVDFFFSGTPNAVVEYNLNNQTSEQITLDENGEAVVTRTISENSVLIATLTELYNDDGDLLCSKVLDNQVSVNSEGLQINGTLEDLYKCDGDKDGKVAFNLTQNNTNVLAGYNSEFYRVDYYETENDADQRTNKISNPSSYFNIEDPQTIWARLESATNSTCYDIASFQLNIYTNAPPEFDIVKRDETFGGNPAIIVENIQGIGPYEFRLNNEDWIKIGESQTSLTFEIEEGGEHFIEGRHTEGCGNKILSAIFLDYPKFFTPNGDGFNEHWNVRGAANLQFNSKIFIFDRFGKLLRAIDPNGLGWDGFYNGKPMPAGDYWFLFKYIQLQENGKKQEREFKSNITLLR